MSAGVGESYKSLAGALTEARSVYLEGSGVGERLRAGAPTRVLEIGFGSGLLFLVTALLAAEAGAPLDHVGVERQPPPAELLEQLGYDDLLAPSPLPAALIAWRRSLGPVPPPGAHRFVDGAARLTLLVGDALHLPWQGGTDGAGGGERDAAGGCADPEPLAAHDNGTGAAQDAAYDAIYHDAFSPATNPALWSAPFLTALAASLRPGGRLVSFTVAGSVRRALAEAGLDVRKAPGPPGGKREVLMAERAHAAAPANGAANGSAAEAADGTALPGGAPGPDGAA